MAETNRKRSPRTFPKEREKKLKQKIQELRSRLRSVEKENRILKDELSNIMKPVRRRRTHKTQRKHTYEDWRTRFLEEVRRSFEKRQEDEGCTINLKKEG